MRSVALLSVTTALPHTSTPTRVACYLRKKENVRDCAMKCLDDGFESSMSIMTLPVHLRR